MYDEFSPDGPVSDHGNVFYDEGQTHPYSGELMFQQTFLDMLISPVLNFHFM